MGHIKVVGLGPGRFGLITLESLEALQGAGTLLLRTKIHPTVQELAKRGLEFATYDDFYEQAADFPSLYEAIADDLVAKAKAGGEIVYAVPGSPLVAERTVVLLQEKAAAAAVPVTILPGMSFLEVLYARLGIDPINGISIIDAADTRALAQPTAMARIVTQVYNRQVASETKLCLMENLPDDFMVTFVHHLALPDEALRSIALFELDRQKETDHLTSLYVPAAVDCPVPNHA